MRKDIYEFWKDQAVHNIKPNTGEEFPEGWNVVDFFRESITDYESIIEIGCGTGRLCEAFDPEKYLGLDISFTALLRAKNNYPNYNFEILENDNKLYPHSDVKLLYTVLLHQSDEDIQDIIKNLCLTSNKVIVAEILGRHWRRKGNPPVFNREVGEYDFLFRQFDKGLSSWIEKPYERYKDTNLSIMEFE